MRQRASAETAFGAEIVGASSRNAARISTDMGTLVPSMKCYSATRRLRLNMARSRNCTSRSIPCPESREPRTPI